MTALTPASPNHSEHFLALLSCLAQPSALPCGLTTSSFQGISNARSARPRKAPVAAGEKSPEPEPLGAESRTLPRALVGHRQRQTSVPQPQDSATHARGSGSALRDAFCHRG